MYYPRCIFISFAILLLSVFLGFLFPGLGCVLLFLNTAVKLRLCKYDYLEKNPQANKKYIPWELLHKDEINMISDRSIRELIFPWKG
jgi:hypothetical protein